MGSFASLYCQRAKTAKMLKVKFPYIRNLKKPKQANPTNNEF